ncbi:hypothetical protein DFH09DRAFT_1286739 [Mycena vulgaris]|nr:hypothetical protein DFH09DRAFT_1286739 [Mycena vulgaris]
MSRVTCGLNALQEKHYQQELRVNGTARACRHEVVAASNSENPSLKSPSSSRWTEGGGRAGATPGLRSVCTPRNSPHTHTEMIWLLEYLKELLRRHSWERHESPEMRESGCKGNSQRAKMVGFDLSSGSSSSKSSLPNPGRSAHMARSFTYPNEPHVWLGKVQLVFVSGGAGSLAIREGWATGRDRQG